MPCPHFLFKTVKRFLIKLKMRNQEIQLRTSSARLINGDTAEAKGAALADHLHEAGLL
jgi:hypothetical protein